MWDYQRPVPEERNVKIKLTLLSKNGKTCFKKSPPFQTKKAKLRPKPE